MAKDDDTDLFREQMADVRRISTDRAPVAKPRPDARARFAREETRQVLRDSLSGEPAEDAHEEVSYARPGVAPSVLRKLRRGKYSVVSELDLHGLNVEMARQALDEFIQECLDLGQHCVRIVHGKGKRSGHGGPVLKPRVCRWLRRRDSVLAFTTAPPGDGGSGALYVLLR